MLHFKAWVQFVDEQGKTRQYATTVAAQNEFEAINRFHEIYGPECLIGWIKEVKLYGLQR